MSNVTSKQRSFAIGQTIFVLSDSAQKIVPAVVVEEITIKKLDGNQTSWKISVGPKNKEKVVDSSRLNGEIYENLDDIREVLKKRLSGFLDQLIDDACTRALKWYGKKVETKSAMNSNLYNISEDEEKIDPENLMESFVAAEENNNAVQTPGNLNSKESVREELKRRLSADDTEENNTLENTDMIELPDGTYARVKINTN